MVGHTMQRLDLQDDSLLLIENVGNLVCPASFDLELLNKYDLLPHLTFDANHAIEYAQRIKPALQVMQISATRDKGMQQWLDWIGLQLVATKL